MSDYTIDNVIIDIRNPELEKAIGKECYCGFSPYAVVKDANRDVDSRILVAVNPGADNPFEVAPLVRRESTLAVSCIIIKKEPSVDHKVDEEESEDMNTEECVHSSKDKNDMSAVERYNKDLLEKYPWLTPYNIWTGKSLEDCDYEYTRADDIPRGWRIAFGDQMLEELDQLLKKYNFEKEYRIVQIKEKFGGLRWYDDGFPEEGWEEYKAWLYKYEDLSFKTCMSCGKPAIGFTKGWIMPLCKDCMKDMPYDPIEEKQ